MLEIGKVQSLEVTKNVDFGVYLDGAQYGEILLPKRYISTELSPGDSVSVFIYFDSEDRIIATTEIPFAQVDECAYLEVKQCTDFGAFLDWGLSKDLFVPFKEQTVKMKEGHSYCIKVLRDSVSDRIIASAKIDKYFLPVVPPYKAGEKVDVFVYDRTDLGYKVVVEHNFSGLLFENEIFESIKTGDTKQAYIKQVREDGKIDVVLNKPGFSESKDLNTNIIEKLQQSSEGFLFFSDKTPPEKIYAAFGVSKKKFKAAIGMLYKQRKIIIEKEGIRLP
ncbi:MAG: S1-like domain-containing RNA-binding protein [Bacteroidales bacterium]